MISAMSVACSGLAGVTLHVVAGRALIVGGGAPGSLLVRVLATLIRPTAGALTIAGVDAIERPLEARKRLSYWVPEMPLPEGLTVDEYLRFVARVRGRSCDHVRHTIDHFKLKARWNSTSLGQTERQLTTLAAVAVTGATVLLLDEPLKHLREGAREACLSWLVEARQRGAAIVIAADVPHEYGSMFDRPLELVARVAVDGAISVGVSA
jgi:ABC-2 type transport system ATP-binding protein